MGASKSGLFSKADNQMADMAKALGHPARIAIVRHLLEVNACICNDLADVIPLAQPTISQHLRELKEAGIIRGTVEGTAICYCLNPLSIEPFLQFLNGLKKTGGPQTCC